MMRRLALILLLPLLSHAVQAEPAQSEPTTVPAGYSEAMVDGPLAGAPLRVLRGGRMNAPALVLVHGLGTKAASDWYPLLPELAKDYRVLAFDLPGFGGSAMPAAPLTLQQYAVILHWLIEQKSRAPVRVIGHSLGAAIALRHAHDFPQDVERLLLIDAAGILHSSVFTRHMSQVRKANTRSSHLDRLLDQGGTLINTVSGAMQDRLAEWTPDLAALQASNASRSLYGDNANVSAAVALAAENFSPLLPAIRTPVWMLWGADDAVAPLRTGFALKHSLPYASLDVLDDTGHVPMQEATADTIAWLKRAMSGPARPPVSARPALSLNGSGKCSRTNKPVIFSNGRWDSITINRCHRVSLRNVTAGKLSIKDSNVFMQDVTLIGDGLGLEIDASNVDATGLDMNVDTALRIRSSRVDIAAAVIRARTLGEVGRKSRLFLSLGRWCDGETSRMLHGVWTSTADMLREASPLHMGCTVTSNAE